MPNNITQIPAPRVPVIEEKTGLMSREWYRFFVNLFNLTGDGSNTISLTDLQVGPPSLDGLAFNTTSYADLAPPVIPALPAGSNTQIQYNNAGVFGATAGFSYIFGSNTLTVGNLVSANFTSAAQGLVPASGGGTSNFLRADGTFAAPPVTAPASPSTSVQFNNAGVFGGSSNFTYATGTNTFTVGPAGATTTIETLAPTGSTVAGTLRFLGKNASATNGNGGGLQFVGGTALGTGTGGGFDFTGSASGATGGGFNLLCGSGTGIGGSVVLESGSGTSAASAGGRFVLNAGTGIVNGGAFEMNGGQAINGIGGAFEMNGGQSVNGIGGGYLLQSGFSLSGNGGDFQFIALGGPLGNGQMYFDTDFGGTVIQLTATTLGSPQLGFYGTVPVSRAAAYTKTYATASRVIPVATFTNLVTTAATNVTPYGFTTQAQADAIATKVNALAADVLILKQLIVSLVNDSSTTLGVGLNAT